MKRHDQKTPASPAYPSLGTDHKAWKPGSPLHNLWAVRSVENCLFMFGLSLPLIGSSTCLRVFHHSFLFINGVKRMVPSVSGHVQEHPGVWDVYFLNLDQPPFRKFLDLTSLLPKWNVTIQRFLCNTSSPISLKANNLYQSACEIWEKNINLWSRNTYKTIFMLYITLKTDFI